jgi:hypothetical protein
MSQKLTDTIFEQNWLRAALSLSKINQINKLALDANNVEVSLVLFGLLVDTLIVSFSFRISKKCQTRFFSTSSLTYRIVKSAG